MGRRGRWSPVAAGDRRVRAGAPSGGAPRRPGGRRGLRAGAAAGRHGPARAGPGRGRGRLRAPARRPRDLRRGVRSVVAPARPASGRFRGAAAATPVRRPGPRGPGDGPGRTGARRGTRRIATGSAGRADPVGRGRRLRRRRRHRRRGRRTRCVLARRDAATPRVRPHDPRRAARCRTAGRRADPAPGAAPNAPLRAALAWAAPRPAGDVPPEPGHGRAAVDLGLAAAGQGTTLAGRPVRHLGLDGAALAAPAALRPGALGVVGGARGVVRVRDTAHQGHAAAARQGPRSRARSGGRHRQRLGRRHADRRELQDVQPEVGQAVVAVQRRRHRRVGRLGPRRPGARRRRDGPPAAQLPSAGVAEPAGRHARVPAAGRRDARGLPVHRRLPAGRDRRVARAARRDPGRRPLGRHATGKRGGRPRGTPRGGRGGRERWRPERSRPPTVVGGPPSDRNAARPIR